VANRKISEFIDIPGAGIDEEDLLTLVHLAEVDPALRNKKITFTEFKNYLNAYYPNGAGGTFSGNVLINANLNVTGQSIFQSVTVSGLSVFSGIVVQNNATVSGTISGNTVTGNTLEFGTSTTVTGTFTALATGVTAAFTTGIFTNLSGTTANFTSGNFSSLSGVSCTFVSGIVVDSFTVPDGTTAERPVSTTAPLLVCAMPSSMATLTFGRGGRVLRAVNMGRIGGFMLALAPRTLQRDKHLH
jgi:hypothetical protein